MSIQNARFRDLAGKFIVFDGPDGSGKTSVRDRVAEHLRAAGVPITTCKDPGGTPIGDRIRSVLLDHDLSDMTVQCETLLFMASRAQLVRQVVLPALKQGHAVLCDRFVSSTCAYQVAAGDDFATILDLARYAIGTTWPDLTLILDVPVEVGFARIGKRTSARREAQLSQEASGGLPAHPPGAPGSAPAHPSGATGGSPASASPSGQPDLDAMERRPSSFHAAVRANFLALPGRYPAPVEVLDATQPLDDIVAEALRRLQRLTQQA